MEANKQASLRIIEEILGAGNLDLADELLRPDAIGHDAALPARGPEGLKEAARGYRAAFPDLKLTGRGGDRRRRSGRDPLDRPRHAQRRPLGIPDRRAGTVTGITIDRYARGELAESWTNWDTLGLLQQLGAVPTAHPTA